jgi:hypothetical protein
MSKHRRRRLDRCLLVVLVPFALVVTGCTATGMGSIPSALSPTDKATFGFSFDGTTQTLSGSYHDPQGMTDLHGAVEVAFKGTGKVNPCSTEPRCQQLAPPTKGGCLQGEVAYESQNPKIPGSGLVFLDLCDADGNGQVDVGGTDAIVVLVDTGPYAGYANTGSAQGNITVSSR